MQALHSKVSMAMFCGEVAQRNIFILLRLRRPLWSGPGAPKHFDFAAVRMKFQRKTINFIN